MSEVMSAYSYASDPLDPPRLHYYYYPLQPDMHPTLLQIRLHFTDRILAEMEDARSECRRRIRIPQDFDNVIRIPASPLRLEYQPHLAPRKMKTSGKSTAKPTILALICGYLLVVFVEECVAYLFF